MSTVLKAAQEIERRGRPAVASSVATAGADEAGSTTHLWFIAMAGLTVTAGIVMLALPMSDDATARPAARPASAPVAVVQPAERTAPAVVMAPAAVAAAAVPVAAVAVRQPAPPPVHVAAVERMDAPWGRVDDDSTAPDDAAEAPPARPMVASLPPPLPKAAKSRVVAPPAPAMRRALQRDDAEDAREDAEPVARGVVTSGVQVRQIFYANDISERAASIRVNGGPAVILHQGETAQGVEVQLITRTGVYIRRGGSIYMVSAKR